MILDVHTRMELAKINLISGLKCTVEMIADIMTVFHIFNKGMRRPLERPVFFGEEIMVGVPFIPEGHIKPGFRLVFSFIYRTLKRAQNKRVALHRSHLRLNGNRHASRRTRAGAAVIGSAHACGGEIVGRHLLRLRLVLLVVRDVVHIHLREVQRDVLGGPITLRGDAVIRNQSVLQDILDIGLAGIAGGDEMDLNRLARRAAARLLEQLRGRTVADLGHPYFADRRL